MGDCHLVWVIIGEVRRTRRRWRSLLAWWGTRSTSIPLGFERNFRAVPPQVFSARARARTHVFAVPAFAHQFHIPRRIAL